MPQPVGGMSICLNHPLINQIITFVVKDIKMLSHVVGHIVHRGI